MKKWKKVMMVVIAQSMLAGIPVTAAEAEETADTRPRTIITTDMECDDMASLIHMLLYANDVDIEGIVYTASMWHWNGDGEHTLAETISSYIPFNDADQGLSFRPMEVGWIEDLLLDEYAEVYPSLIKHDPNYPTPGELVDGTYVGNIEFQGDMREATEGSDFIAASILNDDPRTLYLQAWGGANTIARALLSIEEEYKDTEGWEELHQTISDKVVVVSCGDQDNTYADYIAVNWPDIEHVYCVGGYGYGAMQGAPETVRYMFQSDWLKENIKFGHGALLSRYLLLGDGTYYSGEVEFAQYGSMNSNLGQSGELERYDWISEGDSPCFMYLIPVGLRGLENGNYGSWGGRISEDGTGVAEYEPISGKINENGSLLRWIEDFHNDWAARADWCVSDYEEANHQPEVSAETLDYTVQAGTVVDLNGAASDPDGDEVTCNWFVYEEAGVYSGQAKELTVWEPNQAATKFTVPSDAQPGDYFNLVLEVTDNGSPALTRYAQVIVNVNEAAPQETEAEE